ncbi:MAG: cell wall hydrolase [Mesorhizobium sp.]|uniref:Hydrolase n=4 Tax=Phyllobacteriaceae TaxID=69277 RepID=A0AB36R3V1_9HYPH|nr:MULTISPECIES: cell wall hydrolase [unclassified Mesorhizobium]PAP99243.1 hydrolase [Mesorhizobium mediterraneum]RUU30278.1 cell wall hydrolase [Mesorhizobium sp. M6A.T.Ce.TU.016.01.1.1]RUU42334.1 cell wall hydrolase [Mesorhizobium sp. M6A.T.Ce.TU.002.03.1.1]RUV01265.1 cell wall hydrolase [Mesorhizobium sp. M6A.T.Cr.TU.017.01.1.1]RVB74078.1 cell wall hydrolase [Mesorhizobium sp. M6A.T.Cr.TU.014.01.1.1]
MISTRWKMPLLLGVVTSPLFLAACSQTTSHGLSVASLTDAVRSRPSSHTAKDKECLQRAMFFESNRSSRDGMIAVGTVVMNRLRSGKHGNTICQVVGERGQFAPGVMTRRMNSKAMPDVEEAAEAVLKGERKAKLKNTMFFHTAGLRFPYKNMHYTMVAGGNAFYEKRGRNWKPLPDEPTVAVAQATPRAPAATAPVTLVASAAPVPKATPAKATYVTAIASQPVKPTLEKVTPQKATLVAMQEPMQEPDAARFGGTADTRPVTSFPAASAEPTMAFESTPENTDAIGAMIAGQTRPLEEN